MAAPSAPARARRPTQASPRPATLSRSRRRTPPPRSTGPTFTFSDTQAGVTFLCQLDGSAFSACSSPTTYSGLTQASHTFAVKTQDPPPPLDRSHLHLLRHRGRCELPLPARWQRLQRLLEPDDLLKSHPGQPHLL